MTGLLEADDYSKDGDIRRFALLRTIDHGSVVQVLGKQVDDGMPIVIVFDRKPFIDFWLGWLAAGRPEPLTYYPATGAVRFD